MKLDLFLNVRIWIKKHTNAKFTKNVPEFADATRKKNFLLWAEHLRMIAAIDLSRLRVLMMCLRKFLKRKKYSIITL